MLKSVFLLKVNKSELGAIISTYGDRENRVHAGNFLIGLGLVLGLGLA
jgi:flagellar basal body P-ring protein FlgI